MRGTNGPMDVITRAEFEHSMKDLLTKTDFELRLADTKSEIVASVRETLKDLKVDLFAEIEDKVTRSHNLLQLNAVKTSDLKDAKNEILATMRRNIGEAIDPLKTDIALVKAEVADLKSDMEMRFLKLGARLDDMQHEIKTVVTDGYRGLDERLTRLSADVLGTLKQHERMLDRHDADLYKLRQSGVLN